MSVSQLMPLLPDPEKCSLEGMKYWLDQHCEFLLPEFPSAHVSRECRPRCKAPRWYTLGIPIPNCNELEYDIWLNDYICNTADPLSVKDLIELAENPDKCVLNDLSHYLELACGGGASAEEDEKKDKAQAQGESQYDEYEYDMPIFGEKNSENLHSLGLGNGKAKLPRPSPESIYGGGENYPYSQETQETQESYDEYGNYGEYGMSSQQGQSPYAAPQGQGSNVPAQCMLPPQGGECRGSIQSYHYDGLSRTCKPFIYGGCGGNANRFETFAECQQMCMRHGYSHAAPFELSMQSCGSVQAASGYIQQVPVVLKITGANPNTNVAIFRAPFSKQDDPMSVVRVPDNLKCSKTGLGLGGSFHDGPQQIKAWSVNTQSMGDAVFKIEDVNAVSNDVCSRYVYQAIDMSACKLSNVLDSRHSRDYMG